MGADKAKSKSQNPRGRNDMRMVKGLPTSAAVVAGAILASSALPMGAARAQQQAQQPYVMKISTPTIRDIPDKWAENFAAAVEKDSAGRIKAQLYPASQ